MPMAGKIEALAQEHIMSVLPDKDYGFVVNLKGTKRRSKPPPSATRNSSRNQFLGSADISRAFSPTSSGREITLANSCSEATE